MTVLVLTRHGESEWNARRLLTGWSDPPLSEQGAAQARRAGAHLAALRVPIDRVYTSFLTRAAQSASIMLSAAGSPSVPVEADWRLNERHLGQLEGLTKAQIKSTWGNDLRKRWRDDEQARPPSIDPEDPRHPRHDHRYRNVPVEQLPGGERVCDTASRVVDFWRERVIPDFLAQRNVVVVTHLGPLRILSPLCCGSGDGKRPPVHWAHAEPVVCRMAGTR